MTTMTGTSRSRSRTRRKARGASNWAKAIVGEDEVEADEQVGLDLDPFPNRLEAGLAEIMEDRSVGRS